MGCRVCPAGHDLAVGAGACRACRVEAITAVVAVACPEMASGHIAAAVDATVTNGAVARDLAMALSFGPAVLAGGAPPVVGRLVAELRARGSALALPACAECGRAGLCLVRVGVVGLCGRCRAHQLAEACSGCGRVRVVTARGDNGPLCFSCAPRPARTCGRCGRPGPIARRGRDGEADICNSCFRPPVATCGSCGRDKPCFFVSVGRPLCASCSPRAMSICAHCDKLRPPCARWPEGPVCEPCYRAALARRGTCDACHQDRRLVFPPGVDARRCADCAGVTPLHRCVDCGIEDRGYRHGRCVRCSLAERAAVLLAGPRPELRPVYDAIIATTQPYSAHNWLRSAAAAGILERIASGMLPLTHEALDTETHPRAAGFLRQLLVAHNVLAARDDALIALEAWVAAQLATVADPDRRRMLRSYATWRVLRQARTRAATATQPRTPTGHPKVCLTAAIALCAWLDERHVALSECDQGDIDAWSAEGPPSAHQAADFLQWASDRRHIAKLDVADRHRQAGLAMDAEVRWAVVDRLLHDNNLELTDRVAGCLVLLYAQQISRIVALTVDQVNATADGVYLRLGVSPIIVPEPLGALLVDLAVNGRRYTGVGSPAHSQWLFPGGHPGRPLHPAGLGQRLRRLGIPTMAARRAALMQLAGQIPAAVLADILHLHPTTAVAWVAAAGGDWNTYAAEIARTR